MMEPHVREARARIFWANGRSDEELIDEAIRIGARAAEKDAEARELWAELKALPRKPDAQRRAKGEGTVVSGAQGFRARQRVKGRDVYGPRRATYDLAESDLARVRYERVLAKVERIRDYFVEDTLSIWRRRDLVKEFRRRKASAELLTSPFFVRAQAAGTRSLRGMRKGARA